jgi:hypothetical protein
MYRGRVVAIPCPSCGAGVQVDAKRCPRCGNSMSLARLLIAKRPAFALLLGIAVLLFLGYCYWAYEHP